ncbi:GldG family protein [Nocardioidaceae bacterium]|nr:GldG family protein [Nocardioidaceae bacterium]
MKAASVGLAAAVAAVGVALGTGLGGDETAPDRDAGTTGQPARVLFDAARGQQAGNADWVISAVMPDPLAEDPAPVEESDWTGGLSAWGVALAGRPDTYRLATNPPGRPLTHGQVGNGLDLAKVEVLVLPEPNRSLTPAERRAVVQFVSGGGGLFLIVDHADSDRDADGIDSVGVGAQLLDAFAERGLATGLSIDVADIDSENTDNVAAGAEDHPVVDGAWGRAESSILRGGTTSTIDRGANPAAACLLYRDAVDPAGDTGCFLARSEVGEGRLLLWGDSSPVDDGTGDPGDRLYANFSDPRDTNEAWALNGTDWLARLVG